MTFGKRVDGPAGRRKAKREPTSLRAELVTADGAAEAWIVDMSLSGAKIRVADMPAVGQSALVRIGALEAFGTVVWSAGETCGVDFHLPAADEHPRALAEMTSLFNRSSTACHRGN